MSWKIDYFCDVPFLMSHINTWAQVPLPREGSWYWTHSLEPMDFSDWYPSASVFLNISHLTFYALGTLMSPTTNMALRTVQWSTGRRCPRGCTSGTTIFVLHPNMEMIGLSFPFVRGLWNEHMLNKGSVFTLLPKYRCYHQQPNCLSVHMVQDVVVWQTSTIWISFHFLKWPFPRSWFGHFQCPKRKSKTTSQ